MGAYNFKPSGANAAGINDIGQSTTEAWSSAKTAGELAQKASAVRTFTAGIGGVNAYQVVFVSSANTVLAANAANTTHAGRVVGMAIETKLEGQLVNVQVSDRVINLGWNLTPGAMYYLVGGGDISDTPPNVGFEQKIGVAENPTTLILQIGEPTIL